jgi:hypothetical protein
MGCLAHDVAQFLIDVVVPGCHFGGCDQVSQRCVVSHKFVELCRKISLGALRRFDPPSLLACLIIVLGRATCVFLAA